MNGRLNVSTHPVVSILLTKLRNQRTSPAEFRECARSLSRLLAYEATGDLPVREERVMTPLGRLAVGVAPRGRVGLFPIWRAGEGLLPGFEELLPEAETWHLGFYRDEATSQPVPYYSKLPERLGCEICFALDPMLATGGTAAAAVSLLKQHGAGRIVYVGWIAAPEGLACLRQAHPDIDICLAAVDEGLDARNFIKPGLGDAGNRLFNTLDR